MLLDKLKNNPIKTGAAGLTAIFGLAALISSIEIVQETDRAAVYTMGKLTTENAQGLLQPGLHLIAPFVQDAVHVPVKLQQLNLDEVTTYTKDNQVIDASLAIFFRVPEGKIVDILKNNPDWQDKLRVTAFDAFKNALGKEEAQNVAQNRAQIMQRVTEETQYQVSKLLGLEVTEVQMPNYDFDDEFEAAVSQAANEKAILNRKQTELEQRHVEAQKTIVDAEAAAAKRRLAADAEAYEITKLKEAEAEGFNRVAQSIGRENMDVYLTTQKWKGDVPQVSGDGGGTIVDLRQLAPQAVSPRPGGN